MKRDAGFSVSTQVSGAFPQRPKDHEDIFSSRFDLLEREFLDKLGFFCKPCPEPLD
jgi:hypothetical protein